MRVNTLDSRPGRTHDATAARRDKIVEHLKTAGLGALADLGFLGADKPKNADDQVIVTGHKATRARKLTPGQKQANRILAAGRAPVEHGAKLTAVKRFVLYGSNLVRIPPEIGAMKGVFQQPGHRPEDGSPQGGAAIIPGEVSSFSNVTSLMIALTKGVSVSPWSAGPLRPVTSARTSARWPSRRTVRSSRPRISSARRWR
nr:transposase family protein [Streptomyces sp. TLI_235]